MLPLRTDPARLGQDERGGQGAEGQRRRQRQTCRRPCLAPRDPGLMQVQFDPGQPDEDHHRPPGDAVECGNDVGGKQDIMHLRQCDAEHAGAKQHTRNDLHHHQRRPIVGAQQAPDQPGQPHDERQREQKSLRDRHAPLPLSAGRISRDAWLAPATCLKISGPSQPQKTPYMGASLLGRFYGH